MKIYISTFLIFVSGCGPALTDGDYRIANGYSFSDTGGDGKSIAYKEEHDKLGKIVINARVDSYYFHNEIIWVARRPRIDFLDSAGVHSSIMENKCEFYKINTKTHIIQKIETNEGKNIYCK